MSTILLSITNPKELISIKQFLLKNNIHVVTCLAAYSSYIKALQFEPDLVVSEFQEKNQKEYLNFLKLKNDNVLIKNIPYICYGDECSAATLDTLKNNGIPVYIKRPLNPAVILAILAKIGSKDKKRAAPTEQNKKTIPQEDDLRRIRDRSVSIDEKIAIMRNHIIKLLAFPVTIANILRVTQNEKSGAGDLSVIIKTDPAVSAEILRATNSVFFARGAARVANVKDAIVRIGFIESRKLALSLSVFKITEQSSHSTGFNHTEFWFHSLAVAIIAERIARNSMLVNPEEAFIGGLLHDIGLLLLNEYFNPIFLELLELSLNENMQFLRCEALTLGLTHNLLIKALFTEWNFPQTLISSVPFFSRVDGLSRENLIKYPLAVIITISELMARGFNIGRDADCCTVPIPQQILQLIKMPYGIQKAFTETIYTSLNMFNQILKIDTRTFPVADTSDTPKPRILFFSCHEESYNPVYDYYVNRHYPITLTRAIEEISTKAPEHDILIIGCATAQHKEFIQHCSSIKSLPPVMAPSDAGNTQDSHDDTTETEANKLDNKHPPEPVPIKLIILSNDPIFSTTEFSTETIAALQYPLDLRLIDSVISCFANNLSPRELLQKSTPTPLSDQPAVSNASGATTRKILLAHSRPDYRSRLAGVISKIAGISVIEYDPLDTSQELSTAINQPFNAVFLEFKSPDQVLETVETFKQSSYPKPQFVIIFNTVKKEDLLPLISSGITLFVSENDDDESIEKRVFTILTSSIK